MQLNGMALLTRPPGNYTAWTPVKVHLFWQGCPRNVPLQDGSVPNITSTVSQHSNAPLSSGVSDLLLDQSLP